MKKLHILIVIFLVLLSISAFASMLVKAQTEPPTVSVSPTSWIMNADQNETFTATASGGTGNYTSYQWYVDGSPQSGATTVTFNFAAAPVGTHSITATVTDDSGNTSLQSNAATVTVDSALVAPSVTPTPASVNQGQTSNLTSSLISTGTSNYTYQWLVEAPGDNSFTSIVGATLSSYSFVTTNTTTAGSWNFELQVTDNASLPDMTTSAAVAVTVISLTPSPTPSPTPTPIPTAQPTPVPTATPTPTPSPTPTPTSTLFGLSIHNLLLILAIVVVVVVVLVILAFLLRRRRKSKAQQTKKAETPPPASEASASTNGPDANLATPQSPEESSLVTDASTLAGTEASRQVKASMSGTAEATMLELEINPNALNYLKKNGEVYILTDVKDPQYSYQKVKGYDAKVSITFKEFVSVCRIFPEEGPPEILTSTFKVTSPVDSKQITGLESYVEKSGFASINDWLKTLIDEENIPECSMGRKTFFLYCVEA